MGFVEKRQTHRGELAPDSRPHDREKALTRWTTAPGQEGDLTRGMGKGTRNRVGARRKAGRQGAESRRVVDRLGNTIIINGSVAFLGSQPWEGDFPMLLGQHDQPTTCIPVPGLRHWLAYEKATRFTVDLALALSLGRLR